MPRTAPVQLKACQYLRALAANLGEGSRLPVLPKLAADAGVSLVTMARAARALRDEGVLAVAQRSGIRVLRSRGAEQAPAAPQSHERRWESVAGQITRDIRTGRFHAGSVLGRAKELCGHYGVCPATLRKALLRLAGDQVLRYERKKFLVPAAAPVSGGACLVLLTAGDAQGVPYQLTTRTSDYIRSFENECSRIRARLLTITYDRTTGRLHRDRDLQPFLAGRKRSPALGFALMGGGVVPTAIISAIAGTAQPCSLLDESGPIADWPGWRVLPNVRLFGTAYGELCGRQMGTFLLDLGHRRVAFVSPFQADRWAQARLAGLRSAFSRAGFPDAVVPYTLDMTSDVTRHPQPSPKTRRILSTLGSIRALRDQVNLVMQREVIRPALRPLLEQALDERRVTAWVAANDNVALECLEHVRKRGVAVPGDLSIAGFDNSLPAFHEGLSSYSFNEPAIVHAMVEHVLGSPLSRTIPSRREPIEIEGFIVQRWTTAPVAQPGTPTPQPRASRATAVSAQPVTPAP